jgi:hypothetical protein
MKKYKKFDRNGNPIDDDDEVVRDGQTVRVPHMFMDQEMQRMLADKYGLHDGMVHDGRGGPAGHRPGFVFSNDETLRNAADAAYAERRQRLSGPVRKPTSLADAQADAVRAYQERNERLRNTWKGQSA